MKQGRILVVDDNQGIRSALKILLPAHFAQVEIIASPKTLVTTMETFRPDVVLLDMNFYTDINTGNEGLYWAGELKKMYPEVQIVLFTAYADIALAVEGMKRGAFDFIVKPWDNEKLIATLQAAFTDAHADHVGKFEQADGGTLFLDEIGNIPLHLQAKLLRVLQNRTVTRVGSEKQIPVDIRLICATNMDLEKMVADGRFREDLFYRINTMQLHLPSLRERREDILPLANRFAAEFAVQYHRQAPRYDSMPEHGWPGNIRELRNCIEKSVILGDPPTIERATAPAARQAESLASAEEKTIRDALARCGGNLSKVAAELGISRPTLYSKLKKYDI